MKRLTLTKYHNKQLVSKLVQFVHKPASIGNLMLKLLKHLSTNQSKIMCLFRQSGAKLMTRDIVLASYPALWPDFTYCHIEV